MMRFLRKGDCYALNKPIKKYYYQPLYSFKCLLLSVSAYCYQFSCNVQESRASGTTGYGDGRESGEAKRSRVVALFAIFCVLFSFASVVEVQAQELRQGGATGQAAIKPLQIGDTVPEEIWNMPLQVVEYGGKTKEIRLADYRGKVIILDFWATWCGSCILSMPKMHALDQVYPDDVVLLPVTHESASLVTDFLSKTRSEQIRTLLHSFITIVDGQTLKDLIPHKSIPHIAVINRESILEQITMPHLLSEEIIGKIARSEEYDIPVYRGEMEGTILSLSYDDVKLLQPYFYSALTGYLNGFENNYREWVDSTNRVKRGQYINKPLLTLFLAALQPKFNILMPNRRVMLVNDPKAMDYFHERNPDYQRTVVNRCYEYALPLSWTKSQICQRMLSDLEDLTNFHAAIVQMDVPCLVLKANNILVPKKEKTSTSGTVINEVVVSKHTPVHVGRSSNGAKNYLKSTTIENFIYHMNNLKEGTVPFVIDETGIDYAVDLDLPDDLYNIDRLQEVLSAQGVQVVRTTRKMDMFVMAEGPIEGQLPAMSSLELGKFGYVARKDNRHE